MQYSAIGAAVLGIVPAIAIAASLYEIAFGAKSSDVQTVLASCGSRKLDIGITNVGEAPAILAKVSTIVSKPQNGKSTTEIRLKGSERMPFVLVPNSPGRILSFQPYLGDTLSKFPKCGYGVEMEIRSFESGLGIGPRKHVCKCD